MSDYQYGSCDLSVGEVSVRCRHYFEFYRHFTDTLPTLVLNITCW